MLPRKQRVPSYAIAITMRQGKRILDTHLQLFMLHNSANLSRFTFISPAKVEKFATRRNRLRRVFSESVRKNYAHIKPGWDCVLFHKQKMPGLAQSDADTRVISLLKKAGIFAV